jgi:hypothetical protein
LWAYVQVCTWKRSCRNTFCTATLKRNNLAALQALMEQQKGAACMILSRAFND